MLAAHNDRIVVGPAIAWEVQYLDQCESLGVSRETVQAQGYEAEIEATVTTVEKLRRAEVRLVVGGDYGISIAPHGTYARDLEYFVDLFGMRPAEALICATRNGGEAMDPSGGLGTLKEGSRGDFVIVDGDPLTDIRLLQNHDRLRVFKGGRSIDS
jgi:imidazolonepropionase-like amidohydrolase